MCFGQSTDIDKTTLSHRPAIATPRSVADKQPCVDRIFTCLDDTKQTRSTGVRNAVVVIIRISPCDVTRRGVIEVKRSGWNVRQAPAQQRPHRRQEAQQHKERNGRKRQCISPLDSDVWAFLPPNLL